jgi:hypothetical protein
MQVNELRHARKLILLAPARQRNAQSLRRIVDNTAPN